MIQTRKVDDRLVVQPEGKIIAANADHLRQELSSLIDEGHLHLTIDLEAVDMIDSRGLALFAICHQALQDQGGSLTVISPDADIRGLFHVMRLDEHFTVAEIL